MAVNDLSSTLGYRGLAGVVAVAGVVAAATWVRGLDVGAWLPRHISWLFLTPAALAAVAAASSSGPSAGILTAAAVVLTAGAVLPGTSLAAAASLLAGATFTGLGVAVIGAAVTLAGGWVEVAFIGLGVALIGLVWGWMDPATRVPAAGIPQWPTAAPGALCRETSFIRRERRQRPVPGTQHALAVAAR